ncbi:MAG: YggS family pyridoxal phosphate-dependent enzyme [Deltaproteobacteria bacterium]|nr:YggS family pyridoxal phosphate-dependent enzyme [Deltaproteobacteria bacterium]
MESIKANIERIRNDIAAAALKSGRLPSDVKLMAVTKTVDDERIRQAIDAGVDLIGENYVQEAQRKMDILGRTVPWHFIGRLQTNKAKFAVRLFDMIHSVDRIELVSELDKRSKSAGCMAKILIEVNLSGELTKSGVPKENVFDLVRQAAAFDNISIQGLMTMPPWFDDPEDSRPYFTELRVLKEAVAALRIHGVEMNELSMGMSADYAVAVQEGATIVRIGRSLFGERPVRPR